MFISSIVSMELQRNIRSYALCQAGEPMDNLACESLYLADKARMQLIAPIKAVNNSTNKNINNMNNHNICGLELFFAPNSRGEAFPIKV